jgi:purine-binding chemotaxis protein CheW
MWEIIKKIRRINWREYINQIVIFTLDDSHYALQLADVKRVIRSVEILPLPKAPDIVNGVINVHGQIIPVVNMRKRFKLNSHEIGLDDRFIITTTPKRTVAVLVDSVVGIRHLSERELVSTSQILPSTDYVRGVAKMEDGLVLIYDLDKFLSLDEEQALDKALMGGKK